MDEKYFVGISEGNKKKIIGYINKYLRSKKERENGSFYSRGTVSSIRSLSMATNFDFNKVMSRVTKDIYGTYEFDNEKKKSLFSFDGSSENILNKLNTDGYVVGSIDKKLCDEIQEKLKNITFVDRKRKTAKITEENIKNKAYNTNTIWVKNMSNMLSLEPVQKLVTDSYLLYLLQEYLGSIPILTQTNCWVSINKDNNLNINAQQFHRDFDHERWIKIFVYLKDINMKNGPHCFMKGTHNISRPVNIGSNRLSDKSMFSRISSDKAVYFTGEKGTVVIEDTRGFHKGTPVIEGHRIILQLEFAINPCSFGSGIFRISNENIKSVLEDNIKKYPRTYLRVKKI